jgi:hypothetical protein
MNKDPQKKYELIDEKFKTLFNSINEDERNAPDFYGFLHSALHDQEVETARRILELLPSIDCGKKDCSQGQCINRQCRNEYNKEVQDIIKQFIN